MDLNDFHELGVIAYNNNGPASAILHHEVRSVLWGLTPESTTWKAVVDAFSTGWSKAAEEHAAHWLAILV